MKPEEKSHHLLRVTRSKAKMYEYDVPEQHHIALPRDPEELLTLTISILGELSARTNAGDIDSAQFIQLQDSLRFAARYFDSYRNSHLADQLNEYLLLLGSASYYLCDLPGSSDVLAVLLSSKEIDLGARGLEQLLRWLLKADWSSPIAVSTQPYGAVIEELSVAMLRYYADGSTGDELVSIALRLRRLAYNIGAPRELLLADASAALVRRRYENSSRYCLPLYSGLPVADWEPALSKAIFMPELWPAQRLLGEKGVFEGASAVVQMPTSAGKSRAIEVVIRSAFLSNRASIAVVVAPFRALCREIHDSLSSSFQGEPVQVDELSDVFQADFDLDELFSMHGVIIVTPEKLVYVMRQAPDLAKRIGLLVYDEGHQFDTGARGVTYELLITSLKTMITEPIQTLLISAVLPNAEAIGTWLNGERPNIVSGRNLLPTERTVAFASWQDTLGQLQFVEPEDPNQSQFFVPRVIESYELQLRGAERKPRFFPMKKDSGSIALYLGLRLVRSGSVAIFCGRKDTVGTLCETLVDAYGRGLQLEPPLKVSTQEEVDRISNLYEKNLGPDAAASISARLGVCTHHGNTPHGIRLAVEHAMRAGQVRFVICTSTLAQGVNLPIRYLIVTSIYQAGARIKVRDFHNLIGRAGRSGKHTEGSIIFADPAVYDQRDNWKERWRWLATKELLQPDQSEPCDSTLLSIFLPLVSDNDQDEVSIDPMEIPRAHVDASEQQDWVSVMAEGFARKGFTQSKLVAQILRKVEILSAIESFLMAHWDEVGASNGEVNVRELAEGTLAYFLASDDENREQVVELFQLLANHIEKKASDSSRRTVFSRMLCGVDEALEIEAWVAFNFPQMSTMATEEDLLELLWPVLTSRVRNSLFRKCKPATILQMIALDWIKGRSFGALYEVMKSEKATIERGEGTRRPKIDDVVELCENALGYSASLIIGAITEIVRFQFPEEEDLIERLQRLQKRVKYGLQNLCAIHLYEMGLSDRSIAVEISQIIGEHQSRSGVFRELRRNDDLVQTALGKYPTYFVQVLNRLLQ